VSRGNGNLLAGRKPERVNKASIKTPVTMVHLVTETVFVFSYLHSPSQLNISSYDGIRQLDLSGGYNKEQSVFLVPLRG
jgi:hypothetical protein